MARVPVLALAAWLALGVVTASGQTAAPAATPEDAETEARLREAARLRGVALAEMEDGDYTQALGHLAALEEILPENILPPINLAICHFRLGDREAALAEIERARRLDPDNARMLFALARILEGEPESRALRDEVLAHFAAVHPRDPRPFYLRGVAAGRAGRPAEAAEHFGQALRRARDNLVLMTELLVAAIEARELEIAGDALDTIEDRLAGFEGDVALFAERARELLEAEAAEALQPVAQVLRNLLRPTDLYGLGLVPLTGGGGAAGALFPQLDFDPPLPKSIQGGQDIELAFVDATSAVGLARAARGSVTAAYRCGEGGEAFLTAGADPVEWLALGRGGEIEVHALDLTIPAGALAISYDIDQDGLCDLAWAAPRHGVHLHPGRSGGGYGAPLLVAAPRPGEEPTGLVPIDLDHDGDLDLFLARAGAGDLYLQNNGDGRWTERASELGLDGGPATTTDVLVADLDDDGDLDLVTLGSAGARLYRNRLAGPFEESPLRVDEGSPGYRSGAVADFDGDGLFDLLLWGPAGGDLHLQRGVSSFERVPLLAAEEGEAWTAAAVGDFDNDGDPDVAAALDRGGLVLLRNRRPDLVAEPTGQSMVGVRGLLVGDFDDDGDLDLVAQLDDGARRFWRNEGGHRNGWIRLRLKGKHDGNSKNNTQGLFARIEARVGDGFQALVGNGGVNHIGLGAARQAEVLRVVWTNGQPQTWVQVAANRTLVEEQVLKGSCPFLFTWNGERFEFVTDLLWRSPLGMVLPDGSPAPHQSARDFVLIPAGALAPVGGELWLQVTAELWETIYVDRQELLVVDHPGEAELVVDERLLPPPYAREAPLHWVGATLSPSAARDRRGRDVLREIGHRDGMHVDDLPRDRYQGVTGEHAIELTFEGVPRGERLRLLLWGWIFPTDSSINFALAQDRSRDPRPPRLEILEPDGTWRLLPGFVGHPNGKRKAMVVDLGPEVPGGTVTLRLSSSLEIYWDAARLAVGDPDPSPWPVRMVRLQAGAAHLHHRGYSRLYRESPSGPHLFDYDEVSTAPRFRDMQGRFTRYGPVTELLAAEDDRYAVMNAGDELTVRFGVSALPPLPPGWRRDFVLYTDGWVKDGDLHTAFSRTVEPLPYHGMSAYPDRPRHRYPETPEHREYLSTYQTREVTDRPFRELLEAPASSHRPDY